MAVAGGDPLRGQSTAIICIGCHGSDGNNHNPLYPILAGQGEAYLIKQLNDFKTGKRQEEHMTSMVEAISLKDIPHVAAYFSMQKRKSNINRYNNKIGQYIFNNGIASKNVAACSSCHGIDALGDSAGLIPSLAGQHADYIKKMLTVFRDGSRSNDKKKVMRNISSRLSGNDIKALSLYLHTLN